MLKYLKERVMPATPEKTFAERSLEVVEQGSIDRAQRQQAEADAEAEAAHTQRLELYRTKQAAASLLVAQYACEAQAFDVALRELSAIIERMSQLTLEIQQARDWLSPESRVLQDTEAVVPYAAKDIGVEVRGAVASAGSRGQQVS